VSDLILLLVGVGITFAGFLLKELYFGIKHKEDKTEDKINEIAVLKTDFENLKLRVRANEIELAKLSTKYEVQHDKITDEIHDLHIKILESLLSIKNRMPDGK